MLAQLDDLTLVCLGILLGQAVMTVVYMCGLLWLRRRSGR